MFFDSIYISYASLACIFRIAIVTSNFIYTTFFYWRGFVNFVTNQDMFEDVVSEEGGSYIIMFEGVGNLRGKGGDVVDSSEFGAFIGDRVIKIF